MISGDLLNISMGFIFGILASRIVTLGYGFGTRPLLGIFLDNFPKARGRLENQPPHEFYHLKVKNIPAIWPVPGRKPAWSCKAIIEVFDLNGEYVIPDKIIARWPSHPEPLITVIHENQSKNIIDITKIGSGLKCDVHNHEDQLIDVAIKFEGSEDFHLFSNESYGFPMWQNPDWRLGIGTYKLKITLFYERGRKEFYFRLHNSGSSLDDLLIDFWDR